MMGDDNVLWWCILPSKSRRGTCVIIKTGVFTVQNSDTNEAAKIAANACGSPDKYVNIIDVDKAVRVIGTCIAAAKLRTQTWTGMKGHTAWRARPKAAPLANNGKMTPPRNPPAIEQLIVNNLAVPTVSAVMKLCISKPVMDIAGQICGKFSIRSIVAMFWNSSSLQKNVCGTNIPTAMNAVAPTNARRTVFCRSMKWYLAMVAMTNDLWIYPKIDDIVAPISPIIAPYRI